MPPPTASATETLATRLFLGPALRTQPDRRLVTLVREGYEAAFEEIVRRYRKPLDHFAASIVGGRSEDVTQDAFSKALLALRGSEAEIELRPWLYRIVRNTALNDLRDRPPAAAELAESIAGGRSAAEEAEQRAEMTELMERLGALPEPQRAAIVMRELEGLSHEEIAAALGVSGGAARQAIFRGRQALRDGFGLLLPLPLLRLLIDHGAEAAAGGGAVAGAGAAAGTASAGGVLGGVGVGGALKAGAATVLIAGSVGAGVAVEQSQRGHGEANAAAAQPATASSTSQSGDVESPAEGDGQAAAPSLSSAASIRAEDRRGGKEGRGEQGGGNEGLGEGRGGPGPDRGGGPEGQSLLPGGPSGGPGRGHGRGGRGPDRGEHGPGHGPRGGGPGHGGQGASSGGPDGGGGPGPRGGRQSGGPETDGPEPPPDSRGSGSGHPSGSGGSSGPGGPRDGGPSGSPNQPPTSPPPPIEGEERAPQGETEESL